MTVTSAPSPTHRTIGDEVARFAASARLDEMPAEVVDFGRLLLVDTLGALLGGLRYEPVQRLAAALAASGTSGDGISSARLLVLGNAATWLDADSGGSFHPQGHRLPPVPTAHPAPHLLPVLLLAATDDDLDDASLLRTFVVATEVGLRSGVASSLRIGLHPHGVHGPGAAALATALLGGLPEERLGDAYLLGSCLPLAATLDVPVRGGTVRNAWTGLGATFGAYAAELVAGGARCDDEPYRRLFDGAVCTDLDDDLAVDGLGERWTVLDSYLKPYACARWIHPTLDATRRALASLGVSGPLRPEEVAEVDVTTFAFAASLSATDVVSDMEARFSLPVATATLLADGVLDAGGFLPERLGRADVVDLARRVRLTEDPTMSAALPRERPATVTVRLADGRSGRGEVRQARGNPDQPLSVDEVAAKFRGNTGGLVDADRVDEVLTTFLGGPSTDALGSTRSLAAITRAFLSAGRF